MEAIATAISETDVLIIGAGASGMLAATCAAAYGLRARIIDKRPFRITSGHADGINSRTMEILDSFGVAKRVVEQGASLAATNIYAADENGNIKFDWFNEVTLKPLSPFTSRTLSQAIVQDILEDEYISKQSAIKVERGVVGERLIVKEQGEYPVELTVRKEVSTGGSAKEEQKMNDSRLDDVDEIIAKFQEAGGALEVIKAKYMVACDGAHSWTRRQLNIEMVGDNADAIWGVMDIHPITDFPTPRAANLIQRPGSGLLWIPRERGMVRIYTVLGNADTTEDGKIIRETVTPEKILKSINENLHPYNISYKHCEWWAAYQVGQRMARDNIDTSGRIFLAGDAVHTHSPMAGQGLNVSMQDIFNLMWKLSLVLKGFAAPQILQTYRDERLVEGQRLVNYDRMWAAVTSGRAPPPVPEGTITMDEALSKTPSSMAVIMHCLQIVYPPSIFTLNTPQTAKGVLSYVSKGELPPTIVPGMRMPSYRVRNHSNRYLTWLHETFVSDGRFRFVFFPGDISQPDKMEGLVRICKDVELLNLDRIIDVVIVHRAHPLKVRQIDLPRQCVPFDPETGYDYTKVYYDEDDLVDHTNRESVLIGSAYEKYGIDRDVGALVLLRPDMYVAHCGDLDDFEPVRRYFDGFIVKRDSEQISKPTIVTNGH